MRQWPSWSPAASMSPMCRWAKFVLCTRKPNCSHVLRQEVLPHCDGSTVRCEAVLRVAFAAWLRFCRISRHWLLFLPCVVFSGFQQCFAVFWQSLPVGLSYAGSQRQNTVLLQSKLQPMAWAT